MSETAVIDKVKIDKDGRYTATGTSITTKHKGEGFKMQPGTYPVNMAENLDRIVDKEPLFSHLVRKLQTIESLELPSSATDGVNLFWNKDFLSSMTPDEQCGVLLHEVLHCAWLHLWRRGKREATRWNISCDYCINLIVNRSWPLPDGTLLDTQYADMSADEIYDKLPVKETKQQGWCQKEGWSGQGGDGKSKQGQGQSALDRMVRGLANAGKKRAEAQAKAKAQAKSDSQKEEEWAKEFDQTLTKNYGTAPNYLKRAISQRHYIPVIDWAALVSKIVSEDITDYTFSQPDRRFLDEPFILPDLYSWDRVKDVVFAYDTSGSISQDDLNAFYKETIELWEQFPNLTGWAGVCDCTLYSFKEIGPDVTYKQIHFRGGGGTAFEPIFEEIEKRNLHPKAVFYFTDTYGSFPQDPGYPVFWLVRSYIGDQAKYDLPFGKVIKFMNKSQMADPMQRPSRW